MIIFIPPINQSKSTNKEFLEQQIDLCDTFLATMIAYLSAPLFGALLFVLSFLIFGLEWPVLVVTFIGAIGGFFLFYNLTKKGLAK